MILEIFLAQTVAMQILKGPLKFLLLLPLSSMMFCNKADNDDNNEPPDAVELRDSVVASNLNNPWEILWGPDNHIWMTERGGRVSRFNPATGILTPLLTIGDVSAVGEGGLLGMVLHPDFGTNSQLFVVYNYNTGGNYREKVVRYTYNGTTLINPTPIIENIPAANIHNGSRLLIIDGKLFISTGDASDQSLPQNTSSLSGKILRLNLDGSIPADNPVAGNPYWSWGHRNPQGLVYANNHLYSSEHGPNNDDEVNIITKGANYGWPNVHGFCDGTSEQTFCNANNVVEPIFAWTPTIAISGMDYYNSDLIPQWKNSLLAATLKNSRLYQIELEDNFTEVDDVNEYFQGKYGRMRDICISPAGKVYICTSNGGNADRIIEISPK